MLKHELFLFVFVLAKLHINFSSLDVLSKIDEGYICEVYMTQFIFSSSFSLSFTNNTFALKKLDCQSELFVCPLSFICTIVSRGDWLWKPAIFKAWNKWAISDIERSCHVFATVHKPKRTFKDGGCRRRLILVRRWLWGKFRPFWRRWSTAETISTVANEVSAKYRNIHMYLVCFQENITGLHATVLSRQH